MTAPPAPTPTHRTHEQAILVAALLLTGLSMRTAVTSVGAALDDLQGGLHTSAGMAGLITTLPVICFAGVGALTPRLARTAGPHRLLTLALAATTAGLALRPLSGGPVLFAVISMLALSGGAVSNVLMPSLVKRHFPDRIGTMTAVYTTALAVGATAGAGLTVPIGDVSGGWRGGIGAWALLSALAVLPWLPTLAADRRSHAGAGAPPAGVSMRTLLRSRTAWLLAIFFGTQSMQAYIAFGWFARFLTDHDVSKATAGLMLALLSAIAIPVSLVTPRVPERRHRTLVGVFAGSFLAAYVLMAVAPRETAWVWMVLAGIGGGSFPLVLTLLGTRARTPATTAALSAFVQAIGYVIAGTGPLLFGALFGATGSWALPLVVLFVAVAVMVVVAVPATVPRYVEDELAAAAR